MDGWKKKGWIMKWRRLSIASLLVSAVLVMLTPSVQAAPTGTILGTIRDSNGSVVTGATVTALHVETNLSRSAVTDGNGDYTIASLPIGAYRITATISGFKQAVVPKVVLQVDQKARIDINLEVGEIANQVTIEGTAPVVDTESSSVAQVIDNKKIVDLPLNGRDFTQLAALTPGVLTSQTTGQVGEQTGFTTVQAGGGASNKTEFLLDGVTNQEQLFDGVQFRPSVDTLQEFRVLENSFSAEYGRGSAIVNATTKAGTNQFHGSLFEFLRNDRLDARNFFALSKPVNKQNQFGGTIGGPVKLPRLYDGKDSTFFFYGFEGLRIRRQLTRNTPLPSEAFRNGDFSALATPIRDPLTGEQFTGNQIPDDRISDTSRFLLGFVPFPNNSTGTLQYAASSVNDYDQHSIRVDQQIGKGNLYVRYSITDQSRISPGSLPTSGTVNQDTRTQNVVVNYNHIFSSALLNEARLGYGRLYNANSPQGLGNNVTIQAGIRGFDQTSINFPGFPNINVTGFGAIINGVAFAPIINPTNTWHITDNLTLIHGRHNTRVGVDLRRFHLTSTNAAFSRGNFSYTGFYSGNGFADFLLGYPRSGIRDFPRNLFGLTDNQYHFYIQDDYKIFPKLTLFLGLRYELNMLPTADFAQAGRFDPNLGKVVVSTLPDGQINLISQQVAPIVYPTFRDVIVTAQEVDQPNNLQEIGYKQFAPRLGFAYRPFNNNRTVVRAFYGIFYILQRGNPAVSTPIINLPFILDEAKSNSAPVPTLTTESFFDAPFVFGTALINTFDTKLRPPYLQEWNLAVQHELLSNLALDVAYVGSKGSRLERTLPFNFAPPGAGPLQSRRPFPRFSGGGYYQNSGSSNYHSMQVKLEKRYSRGISMLAAYTWSRLIDDASGSFADPRNPGLERALGDLSTPHRLVTSFSYELPFGRGKQFGSGASSWVNKFIGGWQLGGIVQYQSGFPFTPVLGSPDPANVGGEYARRPNRIASGKLDNPTIDRYFDISAFAVPTPFTIGNSGRNILPGPGIKNWDLAIMKNTHITERVYHQLRLELFNAWNTPQFNNPSTNVDPGSTGGRILSARDPRIIQVAMKLYF
jgi:hypothetical protein